MTATHLQVKSGHYLHIEKVSPAFAQASKHPADVARYTDFYVVRNWDSTGVVFFYMAKGWHRVGEPALGKGAKEIHVWYKNKHMWTGYGKNMKDAIEGAQRDGWMHAE
jgi:hypothetical protein